MHAPWAQGAALPSCSREHPWREMSGQEEPRTSICFPCVNSPCSHQEPGRPPWSTRKLQEEECRSEREKNFLGQDRGTHWHSQTQPLDMRQNRGWQEPPRLLPAFPYPALALGTGCPWIESCFHHLPLGIWIYN